MRGGVHRQAIGRSGLVLVAALLLVFTPVVRAGGPVLVGSSTLGIAGEPMVWDPGAMPVKYRVDGGPLAAKPDGGYFPSFLSAGSTGGFSPTFLQPFGQGQFPSFLQSK